MKSALLLTFCVLLGLQAQAQRHGRGGPTREETKFITCESNNNSTQNCAVEGRIVDAALSRQISRTQCIENQNFGFNRDSLWVTGGCRGEFRLTVQIEDQSGGGRGSRGDGGVGLISCASEGFRNVVCPAQGHIDFVEVARQRSRSACTENVSFGFSGSDMWVSKGCVADFRVFYR